MALQKDPEKRMEILSPSEATKVPLVPLEAC